MSSGLFALPHIPPTFTTLGKRQACKGLGACFAAGDFSQQPRLVASLLAHRKGGSGGSGWHHQAVAHPKVKGVPEVGLGHPACLLQPGE